MESKSRSRSTHTSKKQTKKDFLAPLKSKDGFKLEGNKPSPMPPLKKKAGKVNLLEAQGNGEIGKHRKENNSLIAGKKKEKNGDAEKLDKEEKPEDGVWLDGEKNESVEISMKAVGNSADDMASIASEEVDAWADSPLSGTTEDDRDHQPTHKSKSMAQKKAERSGILKPKKLIFQEPGKQDDSQDKSNKKKEKGGKGPLNSINEIPLNKKEKSGGQKEEADSKDECEKKKKKGGKGPLNSNNKMSSNENGNYNGDKKETDSKDKEKKKKKRQRKESIISVNKLEPNEKESDHQSEEETGTWIQCSKTDCGKWRYVAGIEDPILVPSMWECKMNPDTEHNTCDLPEVDYDESEHICTKFTIGSLVWAKMDGYPWWPGMIEEDPDYNTYFEILTEKSMVPFQYHVTFFDDHVTRAWIRTNFISPYIKGQEPSNKLTKTSKGHSSYKKEIQKAVDNADKAESFGLQERIKTFGFLKRYNKRPRTKGNTSQKTNPKPSKKIKDVKGKSKETTELSYMVNEDTDHSSSITDLSDALEDTEYRPVKTKSRGFKNAPTKEDSQTVDVKRDDTSGEDETESNPDTSKETSGSIPSKETKFDPDIFTMEIDSALPDNEDIVKTRCETKGSKSTKNVVIKEKENEMDNIRFTQDVCNKVIDENNTNRSNSNESDFKTCSEVEKTKSKVSLKSKTPSTSFIEEYESSKPENEVKIKKGDKQKTIKSKDNKTTLVCEKKTVLDQQPQKRPKKLPKNNETVDAGEEEERKKQVLKNIDNTIAHVVESSKDYDGTEKEDGKNYDETKPTSKKVDLKMGTFKKMADISSGEENSEKKETLKKKSKMEKEIKPEDGSDKENLDPFESAASERKKESKKVLKRQTSSNVDCNNIKDSNMDSSKVKKSKLLLTIDDQRKIETKTDKMKTEKRKQNTDDVKMSKKKMKSFTVPLKSKSSDREVPQLSLTSHEDKSKNKSCVNDGRKDSAKNTDPHVVPDMSEAYDPNTLLDTDITEPMLDKAKESREKLNDLSEDKSFTHKDNINYESEEETLDLDIDVQKVDPKLSQNLFNDSDESDIECEQDGSKVVVEKVREELQVFGRFAGGCRDHGSDSDPMELIED
ncbi:hypothetical protein EGW08_002856 [Elysia chlorotica]|uniref:CW-type domain-containing protein n=1 Tax=Elysia chlorotica TaxID=188477 RepID=A0A3S1BQV4_ELYCH|nr:hypothetical protein EGW08_002856 [Elysia chlorotica]